MKLEYGSAKLTGVRATDRVCVQSSLCLSSFEFFLAAANEGLPGQVAGILGLARAGTDEQTVGPRFMEHLLQESVVKDSTFSFYLTSDTSGTKSFINLGGYVHDNIRKGEQITWF